MISDGKKGPEATVVFTVVDEAIYGKEIKFDIPEDFAKYNPNALRFGLDKVPGEDVFRIPDGFISSEGTKTIPLTHERQHLLIWLYDFANCEYMLFAYHIPTIDEVSN